MAVVATAIAGAATASAVAGIASVAALGATAAAVVGALAGAVVSGIVGSALISTPSSGNFKSAGITILSNQKVNNAPIPVIYGTRLAGGTIVYMNIKGSGNFFVNLVVSEGEIEGYVEFYFNGVLKAAQNVVIYEFYGSETQTANSILVNEFANYTTSHKLSGTAYLTFRIKKFSDFPAGMPLFTALVHGVKVFDPRTSLVEWGNNPALCLRDYLTNARYGRGIETSLIDDASFILAANYCDELVDYNGVDFINRYTCNGVVETETNSLGIIKRLLSSCRGILIFSGGRYKIIIDKPEMADFTFSEDNIIGGWKIKLGNKASQYNRMRANFFNASKDYNPDIAYVDLPDLRQLDDGLLETMIDLPFTTDIIRARAILNINLNQSRRSISCEFTATIEGLRVEVGDVVYITHATPSWVDKKFRIMRVTLQNNDEVRIIANEYADEVYDIDVITVFDAPEEIIPHDFSFCLPPTSLMLTQGRRPTDPRAEITASWTASTDAFIDSYQVRYKFVDGADFTLIEMDDNLAYVLNYNNFNPIYFEFEVRAVNTLGVVSEWLE